MDEDSDNVHDKVPEVVRQLTEKEANNSASWLKDNRLCVAGEKRKLLIVGTKKLKALKVPQKLKL